MSGSYGKDCYVAVSPCMFEAIFAGCPGFFVQWVTFVCTLNQSGRAKLNPSMLFLPAKCNDIIHAIALLAQLGTPLCELYMHGFVQVLCSNTSNERTTPLPDTHAHNVPDDVIHYKAPKPNFYNCFYTLFGAELPNLKLVNISGYTVPTMYLYIVYDSFLITQWMLSSLMRLFSTTCCWEWDPKLPLPTLNRNFFGQVIGWVH